MTAIAQKVLRPLRVIRIARHALHQVGVGDAGKLAGRRAVAERAQRVVDRLDRGGEGLVALQGDAHAARAEIREVGEVARHAAQDQRQLGGGGDRIELGPRAHADEEQRIDTRLLVGLAAGDGVVEAGDLDRAGAAGDAQCRILAASQGRLHLADALGDRRQPRLGRAERRRQVGVFQAESADARRFQLLDRALGVERIAIAMVGVDHQRQVAGAVDAIGLAREFTEGEDDQVGRAQHRQRGRRTREHADLEAEILGDAGGDRIEHRAGVHAAVSAEDRAETPAAVGPVHDCLPQLRCRN